VIIDPNCDEKPLDRSRGRSTHDVVDPRPQIVETRSVVLAQLRRGLTSVHPASGTDLVIAYEPIWAIGTGKSAGANDAQEVCATLREALGKLYGSLAREVRILYGGSISPKNAAELFSRQDIDGGLVGGASLEIDSLLAIVKAA
jgi:triosephosphate isomerase (TIM)